MPLLPVLAQHVLLAITLTASLCYFSPNRPLSAYLLLWTIFHASEYHCTARYLPRTLTPLLFLICGARGSAQFMAVHTVSIIEYIWFHRSSRTRFWAGLALGLVGIATRALAMRTCGASFSHYIGEGNGPLVTSGVYAWCRHPSYTGFLVYVAGMQLVLGNVFTAAVSGVVLFNFFRQRIRVEEHMLTLRFPEYAAYKRSTPALVPWPFSQQ